MDPTAAPTTLKLNDIEYQAYPLRDIDHEAMNKWVRKEYVERTRESVAGDPDLQAIVISRISNMVWMKDDGLKMAVTAEGLYKLATLMCRKSKLPPLLEIATADNLNAIYEAYAELHMPKVGTSVEGAESSPK